MDCFLLLLYADDVHLKMYLGAPRCPLSRKTVTNITSEIQLGENEGLPVTAADLPCQMAFQLVYVTLS